MQPHYLRWVGLDRKLVCLNRKISQYAIGVAMAPELIATRMKGHTKCGLGYYQLQQLGPLPWRFDAYEEDQTVPGGSHLMEEVSPY